MSSILSKFKLPTALDRHSRRPIDSVHITTNDWMRPQVTKCLELVPRSKIDLKMKSFARMSALMVPSFAQARLHNRAFFVPMHTIFPAFGDFITGSIHVSGELGNATMNRSYYVNEVPQIQNLHLVYLLNNNSTPVESTDNYDYSFTYWDPDASLVKTAYRKLTSQGRHFYKLITQLGYRMSFYCVSAHGSSLASVGWTQTFSALPLFAFAKVFMDWYYPPQYYSDSTRTILEGIIKTDTSTPLVLTYEQVAAFFLFIEKVMYDSDYFVSAFDNPVAPNMATGSDPVWFKDTTLPSDVTSQYVNDNNSDRTPVITRLSDSSALRNITQYSLDTLKKFTDYVKRHQLAGARSLDRYLARFGVVMEDKKIDRSVYIGDYKVDLSVSDVMSTSDTTGAALGDYAGKGLMRGDNLGSFTYSTGDDYGYFIIISSVVPRVGYCQGIDRMVLHKDRFSFWTPEFDGLGMQAISKSELYQPTDSTTNIGKADLFNGVFGFTSRYAEYKVDRDMLSGDFQLRQFSTASQSAPYWHLMRLFDDDSFNNSPDNIVHTPAFVEGTDSSQYDRIFNASNETAGDKFVVQHLFGGTIDAPMCGLYDDYDFDDNGKDVVVEANGVKAN